MSAVSSRRGASRTRVLAAGLGGITLALTLAACGSDATSSKAPADTQDGTAPAAGECGSVPTQAPKDADGVVAALPEDLQANYNLYTTPCSPARGRAGSPVTPLPSGSPSCGSRP